MSFYKRVGSLCCDDVLIVIHPNSCNFIKKYLQKLIFFALYLTLSLYHWRLIEKRENIMIYLTLFILF